MKSYVKIYDQVLQHATLSFISASLWHLPQLESENNTGRVNGLQWPWHRHRKNKSEKFQYNLVTTSCPQTQTKSQKPFCMFKTCFKGLFRSKMSRYPNSMSTLHPIRLSIHSAGILVTIALVCSIAVGRIFFGDHFLKELRHQAQLGNQAFWWFVTILFNSIVIRLDGDREGNIFVTCTRKNKWEVIY